MQKAAVNEHCGFFVEKIAQKKVSYLHRTATTIYPCFIPNLGEFDRSWSYKTYPLQNYCFF